MAAVDKWALLSILTWASACNSGAADSAAVVRPAPPQPAARQVAEPETRSQPAVRQVGEREYEVTRARLDAALDWLAHDRGEHVVPHARGGTVVGVKVYGIRADDLPSQVAIKNGDMIRDVNGFSLSAADTALRARDELRRSRDLTINFERRDKPMKLIVHVSE